ncbi:cofactor FMO1 FAD enzyme [Colletotrichum kahawae]|uniref:Cofactor FMO1 FAD enzyme n=1 Tax=Colletotrichum kahawae TaxID=34407 RepID=A0AAD9YMY4_COLKA|nr:cofactor FMO1 FAD enzyme [Colletotrichum kahawae]
MRQETAVDVAIIGAGWYGLAAARTYLKLQPRVKILIIDSDKTVGGVWSKERLYPNLVAQVKLGLFNYSDKPMRPYKGDAKDPRVTGEMIHDYLQEYAEDHDILRRIRFNTFVETATQCEEGWRLTLRGENEVIVARKLMVATGVTSIPFMPKFDAGDEAVPVIHSRDLGGSFEALSDPAVQKVVVVGAAKSAYDAVYLLLEMGKEVTWLIRAQGAGPLAILPFMILNMVNSITFASTRLMTHLSPSILNTHGMLYWFFQRTALGLWLVARFWDFLHHVSGVHAGYRDGDHVQMLTPEIDRQSVFWAHSGLGVVTLPDFWKTLHSDRLTIRRDQVRSVNDGTITMKSGFTEKSDFVVMCTGWADHFGMFNPEQKAAIGLPHYGTDTYSAELEAKSEINLPGIDWDPCDAMADREVDARLPFLAQSPKLKFSSRLDPRLQKKWRLYRRVVPVDMALKGDRFLAILGQIHTVQTPLLSEVQSLWAILYLEGRLSLPDGDSMAREVALWNAWTRKRYLNQGQKFPYSLYDFLPYTDSLFRDLGLNNHRKSNLLSEILSPYRPHDFKGFVDEYLQGSRGA